MTKLFTVKRGAERCKECGCWINNKEQYFKDDSHSRGVCISCAFRYDLMPNNDIYLPRTDMAFPYN